ncbi:MAG TPA: glutamate--tRNA ligase family protein [Acidimicrobiales bacterium]|nr:glutamate--tRNA ligase family protein [Acidimicrobiales bacterium]
MTAPRVRFAPSPTGYFHVGSARTALFNWLFARQHGGTFVLRIEDTDAERNREEWVDGILSALAWLGMAPDEGPYRQSERTDRYQLAIDALWDGGFVYACDCTRDDVQVRTKDNPTPGYDGYCRDRGLDRVGPDGAGRALRFRTPDDGSTVVHDVIRGDVTFPHDAMEDFVVVKSTGQPLFVLANVVDDRDMAITHVIRGEDLLPTTPKGLLVWAALDSVAAAAATDGDAGGAGAGGGAAAGDQAPSDQAPALPVFAHLPMLVNEQRKKLSKRKDPVAVESYRDEGYLPEAFRNYLALLGWSPPGDAEKVDVETLVREFRLEDVHHAPAFFDVQKMTHLNGEYVRELPLGEFIDRSRPWVAPQLLGGDGGTWVPAVGAPPWPPERFDEDAFLALAPLVQERVVRLDQVPGMVDFVFLAEPAIDPASWEKAIARDDGAGALLAAALDAYASCPWSADALKEVTLAVADAAGRKLGKAQAPIRVAVTGRTVGPPLFESLEVLGRDAVLRRLQAALDRLPEGAPGAPGGLGGADQPGDSGAAG